MRVRRGWADTLCAAFLRAARVSPAAALFASWKAELAGRAGRIKSVRQQLYDALRKLQPERDWSFVVKQIGMFSYTGLSPAQVENMISKHHIYMTKDGRISLAGLNSAKVDYVAAAMDDSFRNF